MRQGFGAAVRFSGSVLAAAAVLFGAWYLLFDFERPVAEVGGTKQVTAVRDGRVALYDGEGWEPRFWNGVNLGATTPGHFPGDLSPTKEDYLRWFPMMKEMNADVVRVYTILPPHFYEALAEYNERNEDPLMLMQGIWSPEEELIGEDETGRDAYDPGITEAYHAEIRDAARAVHGDATIRSRFGRASGEYTADVSPYMVGWIVGTEWYPYAVQKTDEAHAGEPPYRGEFFEAKEGASPFESWLAESLDVLAEEEMRYGWQHPVAFTNWLTTDPLPHPNEPFEKEDLVSVDPMNLAATEKWTAGYFASYHAYPYYPDFLSFDTKYQDYRDARGRVDPYAGYLNELRAHHEGVPLMITEFGVPSSRGLAHRGPLGRDQGMHTEEEQGRMDAEMLRGMREEGLDGGILFSWQDEWFKFTWNTLDLELPRERRSLWRNRLTNEENFGVVAVEPGESADETVMLDGETGDFDDRPELVEQSYEGFDLSITHDEAHLNMLFEKKDGEWDFTKEELSVGFGSLPGGSRTADPVPGVTYGKEGIQFLLQMRGEGESEILVDSAYDQHTWLYAENLDMLPDSRAGAKGGRVGDFLPWKLAVSRALKLPETNETIPFEEFEAGVMRRGTSDPESPDFDTLADWHVDGDVLEVRIPWMLLGYTDPSSRQVWDYPYEAGELRPVPAGDLRAYPLLRPTGEERRTEVKPLAYSREGWDQPTSHERKKESYGIMREAFSNKSLVGP